MADNEYQMGDPSVERTFGGHPEHNNGTATDVAATAAFTRVTRGVFINNTGTANNLLFSFDDGTTYATLPPESSVYFPVDLHVATGVKVKCTAGLTTTYEMIGVLPEG